MAVIKEVASFDVDTDAAVASIDKYIVKLKQLEAQRKENIKLGKSVSNINKEIAQTEKAISNGLKQETDTRKGLNAQIKATAKARQQLTTETQKNIGVAEKQSKATRKSLRSQRKAFADLKFLAVGAVAAIASELGNLAEGLDNVNQVLFPSVALTRKVAEATKSATLEYVKEKAELDNLFESASENNKNKAEQSAAIDTILQQYGPYLSDLEKEAVRNGDVAAAQAIATDALLKNIVAKKKAAVAEQLLGQIIDAQITKTQRNVEANQGFTGAINNVVGGINSAAAAIGDFSTVGAFNFSDKVGNATDVLNKFTDVGLQSAVQQLKLLGGVSDESAAAFLKQFDGLAKAFGGITKGTKTVTTNTKKAKKEVKNLEGTLAGLQKTLSEAQKVLKEDIQVTDTDALKEQQQEILNLQGRIQDLKTLLAGVGEEEIDVTAIPDIIIPEGFSDDLEKKIQAEQLEIKLQNLRVSIEQIETRGLIDVAAIESARTAALQAFSGTAEARDKLSEEFNEKVRVRERETARQVIAAQLEILAIQRRVAVEAGKSAVDIDKEIAQLRLNLAKLDGEEVTVNIDVETEGLDDASEKVKETALEITEGLGQLSEQVLSFFSQQAQASIARLDEQVQKQKSVLDELLGNQSNANATQIQLERDRLDALNKKREQAAQRERTIAIAQIAINAALTIARAAAEGGGVGSAITIAAALLALTFGFVQARQSAQTAAQGFATGTLSVERKGNPSGTDTVPAYLTEGEAVIPVSQNKAYGPAVEAIYNRRIPASELNAFVKGYRGSAGGIMRNLVPRSMLQQLDANGITLSMLNNNGIGNRQMQSMIKEMKSIKETLAGLPVQRINITERGLTKTVSKGLDKKQYLNKRFS
jgi:hypothetical protein